MLKLLVPVDGSEVSMRAVDHVISKMHYQDKVEIHLINVQPLLAAGGQASSVVGQHAIEDFHREEGGKELASARQRLDAAGLTYHSHIAVGDAAEVIAHYAQQHGVSQIVMGTHGRGALTRALLGSVAAKVLETAHVPVLLVK